MGISPLDRAVRFVGGQSALARLLGPPVTQGHVWAWLRRQGRVPPEYAIPIERATSGHVKRGELRPDIYPDDGAT